MNKIKNFFHTIRSSAYDPAFYRRIRTQPLGDAIFTFATLGIAGIGFVMFLVYIAILPFAHAGLIDSLEAAYPSDLVVTLADGEMSINQPQPYYIKNTLPLLSGTGTPENLVIFDGNDALSSDLRENSAFVIVKKKFLIMEGSNDQSKIESFSSVTSTTTIDKSTVTGFIEPLRPYVAPVIIFGGAFLFIVLAFFLTMLWVLAHLVYVLVPALLVYLFEALRRSSRTFTESYKVALYASIPSAILFYLFMIFRIQLPIPFAYTIMLLLVAAMNISEEKRIGAGELPPAA